MNRLRLYRLANGTWVHYSRRGDAVILRTFSPGTADFKEFKSHLMGGELDELLDGATEVTFRELVARLSVVDPEQNPLLGADKSLALEQTEKWRWIFDHLDGIPWDTVALTAPEPDELPGELLPPRIIPQTRLRHFYEFLTLFPSQLVHEQIATYVSDPRVCANTLQVLFADAVQHFSRYDNGEAFRPPRLRDDWWQGYLAARPDPLLIDARALVARLWHAKLGGMVRFDDGTTERLVAVDFEISPFRTTGGAYFENGKSARHSGQGGIDLLLRNEDGLPVITEIKAPGDKNLFLALIQALTYAAEMTTPNQWKRLAANYPEHFAGLSADPARCKCDLYLVTFAAHEPGLETLAEGIAQELLRERESPVAGKVRRILFLKASLADNGSVVLEG